MTNAVLVVLLGLLGAKVLLLSHYSVVVRNVDTSPLAVEVTFADHSLMQATLGAGSSVCTATTIDRDGEITVRAGTQQDSIYVSPDLGHDMLVEVTSRHVRFVRKHAGIVPWRSCW